MAPPPEALKLKAAFGEEAFARLKAVKNRYRDGDGLDAQGFLTAFYALASEDDGLAARADTLLGPSSRAALAHLAHQAHLSHPARTRWKLLMLMVAGLVTALLPPPKRGALRDPTLRGRARSAATASVARAASSVQHFSATIKSLQHPPTKLQLRPDQQVEHLRTQVCRSTCFATRHLPPLLCGSLSSLLRSQRRRYWLDR